LYLGQNYYFNGTNRLYLNNTAACEYQQSAGIHSWWNAPSGTAGNAITFTQAMTLDASGNLGVGTTSPSYRLDVSGFNATARINSSVAGGNSELRFLNGTGNNAAILFGDTDAADVGFIQYVHSDNSLRINVNAAERARIDSSGNLLVGTTTSSGKVTIVNPTNGAFTLNSRNTQSSGNDVYGIASIFPNFSPNNTSSFFFYGADSTAVRLEARGNGGIANYSANDVNLSDRREKTNFAPAKSYLDVICAIPVQTFNYIDQNLEEDAGLTLGVVAQDVQAVAPELVMESNWAGKDEAPKMRLSIYQTDLQYALMKCIQEQQAIIKSQSVAIEALKARLDAANL
jgi:hypothetical protein